jgi:predicted transcriptional regulator
MAAGSFYFDPEAAGLAVFLGPTETLLMELAWKHQEISVKSALYALRKDCNLAYTTVMTVLNRLAEKGLLTRTKDGRNFVYQPALDRDTFIKDRVNTVDSCIRKNFKTPAR